MIWLVLALIVGGVIYSHYEKKSGAPNYEACGLTFYFRNRQAIDARDWVKVQELMDQHWQDQAKQKQLVQDLQVIAEIEQEQRIQDYKNKYPTRFNKN
jgi:hypothetical protein